MKHPRTHILSRKGSTSFKRWAAWFVALSLPFYFLAPKAALGSDFYTYSLNKEVKPWRAGATLLSFVPALSTPASAQG